MTMTITVTMIAGDKIIAEQQDVVMQDESACAPSADENVYYTQPAETAPTRLITEVQGMAGVYTIPQTTA